MPDKWVGPHTPLFGKGLDTPVLNMFNTNFNIHLPYGLY